MILRGELIEHLSEDIASVQERRAPSPAATAHTYESSRKADLGSFKMRKFAVRPDAACREAPQLPAELWEYIFRHLSIKDWACAAATCRPFWAVQPYRAGMCRICLDKTGSPLSEGRRFLLRRIGKEAVMFADIEVNCYGVAVGKFSVGIPKIQPFSDSEHSIGGELFFLFKGVVQAALAPASAHSRDASMEGHRDLMTVLPLFQGVYKMPFTWLDVARRKMPG
ncbi:g3499 [Coccomyxa viridis]|uniref:G3499 protein n=1 Tax=Coccomyxa viridis TaxID=1274662 RepID=A0ABP1FRX1_9CHLO